MTDAPSTPLNRVGLIMAPTHRSRAYVQALAHAGLAPARCFAIPGDEPKPLRRRPAAFPLAGLETAFEFAPDIPAIETVKQLDWDWEILPEQDINAVENHTAFGCHDIDVLIYSGMPKALLTDTTLNSPIRFLHVHGGYLPVYRGATGFYFGLLVEGKLGNTAIWIDGGVDTGPILDRRWYSADFDPDVDHISDPVTRADLLVRVLQHHRTTGDFPNTDPGSDYEHFYVIHPVLKHLALRNTTRDARAKQGGGFNV